MPTYTYPSMLLAAETMVLALPTIVSMEAAVYIGVPESFETTLGAFLTVGSATPEDGAMGLAVRSPRVLITLGYRVGGDERTAELAIESLRDELTTAIETDPTLGGSSDEPVTLDMSMADRPDYQGRAGAEVRAYPIILIGQQQHYS